MKISWKILLLLTVLFISKSSTSATDIDDDHEDQDENGFSLAAQSNERPRYGTHGPADNGDDRDDKGVVDKPQVGPEEHDWPGEWELYVENSGVSAMHAILLPRSNMVQFYDATIWRVSALKLPPGVPCNVFDPKTNQVDCWAHSVLLDVETKEIRGLKLGTDTWCSSGGLTPNGTLVSTGGFRRGANTARYLACDTCDWVEYPKALAAERWYSTQVTLPDGNFIVFGGRKALNYELIPPEGSINTKLFPSKLLEETNIKDEYNLYPHVYLNTDGNLFVFANDRSILLDWRTDTVLLEYPILPGNAARNYPAAANSALLPLLLNTAPAGEAIPADVIMCGGARKDAYGKAGKKVFDPALLDCARMTITSPKPTWVKENMPSRRVMGDTVILPTGDVLLVNGAKRGCSGWGFAKDPNYAPVLYMPELPIGQRFKELAPSKIPRMYHSTAILLADGKVLVAGSNTNDGYVYNAEYPTELRVEKFSPPYLDPSLARWRPEIVAEATEKQVKYGQNFQIQFKMDHPAPQEAHMRVTMYAPAFTTHSMSMNMRLVVLALQGDQLKTVAAGVHNVVAVAPPSGNIAPPGYYLLFVNYLGVPSVGRWIQIL